MRAQIKEGHLRTLSRIYCCPPRLRRGAQRATNTPAGPRQSNQIVTPRRIQRRPGNRTEFIKQPGVPRFESAGSPDARINLRVAEGNACQCVVLEFFARGTRSNLAQIKHEAQAQTRRSDDRCYKVRVRRDYPSPEPAYVLDTKIRGPLFGGVLSVFKVRDVNVSPGSCYTAAYVPMQTTSISAVMASSKARSGSSGSCSLGLCNSMDVTRGNATFLTPCSNPDTSRTYGARYSRERGDGGERGRRRSECAWRNPPIHIHILEEFHQSTQSARWTRTRKRNDRQHPERHCSKLEGAGKLEEQQKDGADGARGRSRGVSASACEGTVTLGQSAQKRRGADGGTRAESWVSASACEGTVNSRNSRKAGPTRHAGGVVAFSASACGGKQREGRSRRRQKRRKKRTRGRHRGLLPVSARALHETRRTHTETWRRSAFVLVWVALQDNAPRRKSLLTVMHPRNHVPNPRDAPAPEKGTHRHRLLRLRNARGVMQGRAGSLYSIHGRNALEEPTPPVESTPLGECTPGIDESTNQPTASTRKGHEPPKRRHHSKREPAARARNGNRAMTHRRARQALSSRLRFPFEPPACESPQNSNEGAV
ncbi:hypothetical protein B0H10DRAFT_1954739 [Mycena sp. CBHHK59/15]|nr:hypothetical protein B0H10DRAFT_1954739 [Mycena sp. CBHHK59/15]